MPNRPREAYAEQVLLERAVRNASGVSAVFTNYGVAATLRVQLEVFAVGGTAASPTLDVILEDSLDGQGWNEVGRFTQAAGVTREVVDVTAPFADRIRVRYVIAADATFDFAVLCVSQIPSVA